MNGRISIERNGQKHWGRRFLRMEGAKTYQTVFYEGASRCDAIGYGSGFADDDPAMNAAAAAMLDEMIDASTSSKRT